MSLAYEEHYSVKDYEKWQGDWELIHGEPYAMTPSPSISHQRLEKNILLQLDSTLKHNKIKECTQCEVLSEVDWYAANDTIVRPDVLIACNIQGERLVTTPEVIVEIISPSTARRDELLKFELYQNEGVKIYILVYPDEKKAKVYGLVDGSYLKVGDFSQSVFEFDIGSCMLSLNFAAIW